MTLRLAAIGLFLTVFAAAPACAADSVIVQKGRAFHPDEITIAAGQVLTFTNNDSFIHQIYVDGLFDSDERVPGQNLKETFTKTGTFTVRCHIHPLMRMIVHVK